LRCIKSAIARTADDRFVRFSLVISVASVVAASGAAVAAHADEPGAARQRELVNMVRQDCGSCHGMTFRGGLGPPLTPEALREKPAGSLALAVLNGRPGTPMPPWRAFVSDAEAEWIVTRLQKGFPDVAR
jgi:cytochrome c55X